MPKEGFDTEDNLEFYVNQPGEVEEEPAEQDGGSQPTEPPDREADEHLGSTVWYIVLGGIAFLLIITLFLI